MATRKTLTILAVSIVGFAGSAPVASAATSSTTQSSPKKYINFITSFGVRCKYDAKQSKGTLLCRNSQNAAGSINVSGGIGIIQGYAALPSGTTLRSGQRWAKGSLSCVIRGKGTTASLQCRNKKGGFSISRTKLTKLKPR